MRPVGKARHSMPWHQYTVAVRAFAWVLLRANGDVLRRLAMSPTGSLQASLFELLACW